MKEKEYYILHSEFCKNLANPKRLEILDTLRVKEMTVNELAEKTSIPQSNLSQHLALMRTKGAVIARQQGTNIFYSLSNPKLVRAFDLISDVLHESLATQNKAIRFALGRK